MIRNSSAAITTAIRRYHPVPSPDDSAGAGACVVATGAGGVAGGAATAGGSVLAAGGSDFAAGASVLGGVAWASVASTSRSVTTSGAFWETTVAVISSPLLSCATGTTLPSL